jgi:hypothetical protein
MSLFDSISAIFAPARELSPQVRSAIDSAAQLVGPMLRAASGYPRDLAGPASRALEYCAGLAQSIPGPVQIGRRAFAADPFVHALFGRADDIREMLGRSHAVREYLDSGAVDARFHALLGMRRKEKRQFGMALEGEMIRTEVPQTLLYFGDHTLSDPATEAATARERLQASMFRGLAESFALHVRELQRDREQARLDRVVKQERAARQQNTAKEIPHAAHSRRLRHLDVALSDCTEDLTPARLLDQLAACFDDPSPFLRLDEVELNVDRMGVVADGGGAGGSADRLRFVEMTSRDRRQWVVVLACIARDEALEAVRAVEQATRYIVI